MLLINTFIVLSSSIVELEYEISELFWIFKLKLLARFEFQY